MSSCLIKIILMCMLFILNNLPSNSVDFHTETRSTRLIHRTKFGSTTECSVRLGEKQFTLKFYKMITCRYVEHLGDIYPYLLKYSNDINVLEIVDSKLKSFNLNKYVKVFKKFEYFIFHRTTIMNSTNRCLFDSIAKKIFYLHLTQVSPSLDRWFSNKTCSVLKRLHVLILDQTNLGNEQILRTYLPNLHLLRLNFSSIHHPFNASYLRSFVYLQDFLLNIHDDCHRCEYEWLKYAARDEKYFLFHISPNSGCIDWSQRGKFVPWKDAPLCGTCSLPLIINRIRTNQICQVENGITEHYCRAFYGRDSLFDLWTTKYEKSVERNIDLPSTMRPRHEFMKSKYTMKTTERIRRDLNTTKSSLIGNDSNVIVPPPLTNHSTTPLSTLPPWQARHVVTRRPIDRFNRSYCPPIVNSSYRPKIRRNLPSLAEQLFNISQEYAPNCSNIQCSIIQANYSGPLCLKNGLTYANICQILHSLCTKQLEAHEFEIDYFGSCVSNCSLVSRCFSDNEFCVMTPKPYCIARQRACTGYAPVCDTYGQTFVNHCHLANSLKFYQPRQIAYRGPCSINRQCRKDLCQSNEICIQTQDKYHYPVCINCHFNETVTYCPFEVFCGDNQRQYINRCQLHYERCQTKTFIQIAYFGLCRKKNSDQ